MGVGIDLHRVSGPLRVVGDSEDDENPRESYWMEEVAL